MKLILLLLVVVLIAVGGGWWRFYGRGDGGGYDPAIGWQPSGGGTPPGEVDVNAANDARRKTDLAMIKVALVVYKADHEAYPSNLSQLVEGGYLSSIPKDPVTGEDYGYDKTDFGFVLSTTLSDGTPYSVVQE